MIMRRSIFLYGICFTLIVSSAIFISPFIVRSLSTCLYPALVLQHYCVCAVGDWWYKPNERYLVQQCTQLQQENEKLLQEIISLKATASCYEHVKELVEFRKQYQLNNAHVAQIIYKHFTADSHYVFVNKGSLAGVQSDMVAIYNNAIIGRIDAVYPYYSKVVLITDRSCKVAAYCASTKAIGIYEGTNNLSTAALSHVSHLQQVEEGDLIISSGEGLVFPEGFALGTIYTVERTDIHHKIQIKSLLDVSTISYCYLIQKGDAILSTEQQEEIPTAAIEAVEPHATLSSMQKGA